jgi:hypothetical protein
MVNGVKVTLDISINHPPSSYERLFDHFHCLLCAAFGTKSIRVIAKVSFKDWFNHQLACLLNHPVAYRWYSQWPLSAIRFWDVDA